MLISLGNFGRPFLTWKTYIYKQTRPKTIAIPKIIFKSYMKKSLNTKSTIMGNSTVKIRKLKERKKMNKNNKR